MENAQKIPAPKPIKLDFGCGPNKREGFTGIDVRQFGGKVDIVLDIVERCDGLFKKWPWDDESVDEAHTSHFVEHLTGDERVHFFNELYRVLKFGAQATIIVPSWTSERAYGDPTHKWPPFCGFSFFYMNKAWRDQNAPHVGYTCDFDFAGGNSLADPWGLRAAETQAFAQAHYLNVAQDILSTVSKVKRTSGPVAEQGGVSSFSPPAEPPATP